MSYKEQFASLANALPNVIDDHSYTKVRAGPHKGHVIGHFPLADGRTMHITALLPSKTFTLVIEHCDGQREPIDRVLLAKNVPCLQKICAYHAQPPFKG